MRQPTRSAVVRGPGLRVLQLVSSAGFYGAEQMVCLLSASLTTAGVDACLGLFNADAPQCRQLTQRAEEQNTPVWNLHCKGRWDLSTFRSLIRFLRAERVDVVHTHGYKANVYGWVAARLAGCAIVATCHNWTERTSPLQFYARLDRLLLRRFDMVAAVSRGIVSQLRRAGIRKQTIRVISNGIDVARYQHITSATQHGPFVLGCISRLSKEKGVDVLLWALPKILRQYPTLQCVIAGEGVERDHLRILAETLGVSQQFHLPGFCDDTAQFLSRCTIMVQPSRMEAMPLAILEAMAAGKAIVASAVGEIPRLLDDGSAGCLVPPGKPELLADAIIALLSDAALRQDYEQRAQARAIAQFDVSAMTREYVRMYQAVSARRGTRVSVATRAGVSL